MKINVTSFVEHRTQNAFHYQFNSTPKQLLVPGASSCCVGSCCCSCGMTTSE